MPMTTIYLSVSALFAVALAASGSICDNGAPREAFASAALTLLAALLWPAILLAFLWVRLMENSK